MPVAAHRKGVLPPWVLSSGSSRIAVYSGMKSPWSENTAAWAVLPVMRSARAEAAMAMSAEFLLPDSLNGWNPRTLTARAGNRSSAHILQSSAQPGWTCSTSSDGGGALLPGQFAIRSMTRVWRSPVRLSRST